MYENKTFFNIFGRVKKSHKEKFDESSIDWEKDYAALD
jgi:hypothetical protein